MRFLILCPTLLLSGCASAPEGFDSPEPAARLRAISKAAAEQDRAAIPRLIESLDNDDPIVRLAAIRTLQELTGETLGYDYAAPSWKRKEQVAAWNDWYHHQSSQPQAPSTQPAHSPVGNPVQSG